MYSPGGVTALSNASQTYQKSDTQHVRLASKPDVARFSGSQNQPAATPAKKAGLGIISGLLLCGGGIVALLATAVGIVTYSAFSLLRGGIGKITGLFSSGSKEETEEKETKTKATRK
jgi:hypothetical protein